MLELSSERAKHSSTKRKEEEDDFEGEKNIKLLKTPSDIFRMSQITTPDAISFDSSFKSDNEGS